MAQRPKNNGTVMLLNCWKIDGGQTASSWPQPVPMWTVNMLYSTYYHPALDIPVLYSVAHVGYEKLIQTLDWKT